MAQAALERADEALRLMTAFAARTGLVSDRPPRRYLWTDSINEVMLATRLLPQGFLEPPAMR